MNNYTDEFRANVVAVVRHGLKIRDVAARLNLPTATIYGWVQSSKFASVPPAGDEVLKALPKPKLAKGSFRISLEGPSLRPE